MWRIRTFEIRAMELFEEKLIRGSVHPYIGMEAIAVGVCAALRPDDFITSTHRGHGHCVAKGLDLRRMMAEIIGREDGYCRGRGGSMHITAIEQGMLGADAIVAGSSALAVGAAHGLRLKGRDSVVVCFFGDGAANQGILHEACNLAARVRVQPRPRHRDPRAGLRVSRRRRRRERRGGDDERHRRGARARASR
jgi:acetoin:2,6-dichlorophenolindophenol oxidoreductase subunit alpha